ncbi:MAG: hypothetical protein PHW24_04795 [Candidatus Moranbacteria bacterium]|nr:hypothetical protein [Candidatus Moranbacteria bacterium]
MNTKKVKRVVRKNVKVAKAKGAELKAMAKIGYNKLKKEMNISPAEAKALEVRAMKEYEKIKKQMDATSKKVEAYVKKNPEKVAAISAGIGMALGAVAGVLASHGRGKGKKKK